MGGGDPVDQVGERHGIMLRQRDPENVMAAACAERSPGFPKTHYAIRQVVPLDRQFNLLPQLKGLGLGLGKHPTPPRLPPHSRFAHQMRLTVAAQHLKQPREQAICILIPTLIPVAEVRETGLTEAHVIVNR